MEAAQSHTAQLQLMLLGLPESHDAQLFNSQRWLELPCHKCSYRLFYICSTCSHGFLVKPRVDITIDMFKTTQPSHTLLQEHAAVLFNGKGKAREHPSTTHA